MKSLLISFFLLNTLFVFSQEQVDTLSKTNYSPKIIRINFQVNTLQSVNISDSTGNTNNVKNNSFAIGVECIAKHHPGINYGVGVLYEFKSTVKALNGELGNLPIYCFFDYQVNENKQLPILLSARIGVSFPLVKGDMKKLSGGLYHSVGITTNLSDRAQFKLQYSNDYCEITKEAKDYSLNIGSLNFVLSFLF